MTPSPALIEIISDELMELQMRGPFRFGHGTFGKLALRLWGRIDDQLEKEEMELRQRVAAE